MPGAIGLFEAIYSQRAIRSFKPEAVSDETVSSLIEAATKAPSGGNRQPWRFLVIRDTDAKRRIGEYYWRAWEAAYRILRAATPPEIQPHVRASAAGLAENMAKVPLLVLACVEHDGSPSAMGRGSSIYPAVQNLLLATQTSGSSRKSEKASSSSTLAGGCSALRRSGRLMVILAMRPVFS